MSGSNIPTPNDNDQFPAPGVYFGLPADVYHPDRKAVSNSRLGDLISKSPAHFKYHENSGDEKDTAAMSVGRLVHLLMESGENIACYSGPVRRGKGYEKFVDENEGKVITTHKELAAAQPMELALKQNLTVSHILEHGLHEVTAVAEISGVLCKARADFIVTDGPHAGALVDWKTTTDASPDGFLRSVDRYRYAEQAALYLAVFEAAGWPISGQFLFACVEKDAPHVTQVYELDSDILEIGRRSIHGALAVLRNCRARNDWPGYCLDGVVVLDAPQYGRLAPAAVTWGGEEVAL